MLSHANVSVTAAYITHQLKYINSSGIWWLVIVLVTHKQNTAAVGAVQFFKIQIVSDIISTASTSQKFTFTFTF